MFPPNSPTPSFPYQVLEQVGIGSMGTVYRALEVDLNRTVAIKTLRSSLFEEEPLRTQEEMRRRFLQEAQAAGRISHPGVTTVYRVGEQDGLPFLVMEWLQGQTLEALMNLRRRLPVIEACHLALEVLDALQAAHRSGVVHRDIKPSNLVLLDSGRLKVTDFGIARIQGNELVKTQAGMVLATPRFASPEQLRGMEVDGRADVFAVGVLLYHMVTGAFPFEGNSFLELATAILQSEPTELSRLLPDVPPELVTVIQRALQKDRADRYPSAGKMADALRQFLQLGSGSVTAHTQASLEPVEMESVVRGLPRSIDQALMDLAAGWPGNAVARQATAPLLERLLERPLHAPPFAGAVFLDDACLFLGNGLLLAAVDGQGRRGDSVVENLPEEASPDLHPVPATLGPELIPTLTSILHPPKVLHSNLDSSFINLPAMAGKLQRDQFEGLFRLRHGADWGLVCFVKGQAKLSLYSEGWSQIPVEKSWQHWISEVPVVAQVEETVMHPPAAWFRHAFRDLPFEVELTDQAPADAAPAGGSSARLRQLLTTQAGTGESPDLAFRLGSGCAVEPFEGACISYEQAPAAKIITWMSQELPRYLAERELLGRWKYLAEWILLIRQARAYHRLPRPGSSQEDVFDLVTFDDRDKVLHLAHRLADVTVESFHTFLDRVIEAKTARRKSGDVGGVILVSPQFSPEVLQTYAEAIGTSSSSRWFSREEAFTGYEGFVRVGPRRGFHLMLATESDTGFDPVLPSAIA